VAEVRLAFSCLGESLVGHGHTDKSGTQAIHLPLSRQRAESVKLY